MKQWKIADFGLTSHGTTTGASPTVAGRGTSGYRAPELLRPDDNLSFNKKADIWSIGCILFELCTGTKAFGDDWATLQFAYAKKKRSVVIPGVCKPLISWLCNRFQESLDLDPKKRLSAEDLRRALEDPPTEMHEPKIIERLSVASQRSGTAPKDDFLKGNNGDVFVMCDNCGHLFVVGGEPVCGNCGRGVITRKSSAYNKNLSLVSPRKTWNGFAPGISRH
jgi:serine/threonine protein kinase